MTTAVLFSVWTLNAQSDRRPAADGQQERTEKQKPADVRQHAEERSRGAAFSGRGRGADKNLRDKEYPRKNKKEKKGHKKHMHRGHHPNEGQRPDTQGDDQSTAPPPRPDNPGAPSPAPSRRPGERPTSGAEPKTPPRRQ